MNIDERIRRHLVDSTSNLRAPDHLSEVMKEGRRRQLRTRLVGVMGAAAVMAAVFSVAAFLRQPLDGTGPVATSPATASSTPTTDPSATTIPQTDSARGMVVAGPEGITVIGRGGDVVAELQSPQPHSEISSAYPDGRGGLVYQHVDTPPEWQPGAVLHLEAGASSPSELLAPPDGGSIVLAGTGIVDGGPVVYYIVQGATADRAATSLMALSLDRGDTWEVATIGASDVSVGGPTVAAMDRSDQSCVTVSFVDVSGNQLESPLSEECLPLATGVAVADDGLSLAILAGEHLEVRSIQSGAVVLERDIPGAYMVSGGMGGWVVRTPDESLLVTKAGIDTLPAMEGGTAIPYSVAFDFADGASLGPASTEVESPSTTGAEGTCVPSGAEPAPQDLPAPVSETRDRLYRLAAACDYAGLAEIAGRDGTNLSSGEVSDPDYWTDEERRGEELRILVRLLDLRPLHDPEAGLWAWPAVHVDPEDDAAWEEAEAIHDADLLEQMRQSGVGYSGYRIGIADDGSWMFFVAGD